MAECNYCGKEVSPSARVCPRCGEPDPARDFVPDYEAGSGGGTEVDDDGIQCLYAFTAPVLIFLIGAFTHGFWIALLSAIVFGGVSFGVGLVVGFFTVLQGNYWGYGTLGAQVLIFLIALSRC